MEATRKASTKRMFCRCRRHCPNGNMVSRSTYFAHRKIDRMEGSIPSNDSDADDETTDSDRDRALRRPSVPVAAINSPGGEESRRGSPYRRQHRNVLDETEASVSRSPVAVSLSGLDPALNEELMGGSQDGSDPMVTDTDNDTQVEVEDADTQVEVEDPSPHGTPASSLPPSPSLSDDEASVDDIEDVLFSSFDIEDLLYASQIVVEPWLRLGLVLLRWKSRKNISTHAYDDLRHELDKCLGIKVPSSRVVIRHLQEIVGVYPVKVDCCANGCRAYVGRYRRGKKCGSCGAKRYQTDRPGDEDIPDTDPEDSDLSDAATYDDDLEDNNQVSPHFANLHSGHSDGANHRGMQRRTANKSFLYIPLIPRLTRIWADRTMATAMKTYREQFEPFTSQRSDTIHDFWDGRMLRNYLRDKGLFERRTDTALQLSIDGVSMVTDRSFSHTTTPVLLQILNLPPNLRFKRQHKLLCMLLPGPHEPKNLGPSWLRPLWREMRQLHHGVKALDGSMVTSETDLLESPSGLYNEDAFFSLRAYITLVVGDQVAMNSLGCFKGAGSLRSCRMCWHTGIRPEGSTIYYPVHDDGQDLAWLPLRNDLAKFARDICAIGTETAYKESGIKGLSFLLQLPRGSVQYPFAIP
jgi:hypothetical protein